jgi:hypothetical protein
MLQVYNSGSLASVIFGLKPQLLPFWSALAGAPVGHEGAIRLFQRYLSVLLCILVCCFVCPLISTIAMCRHIKDKFKYDAEDPRASHATFHGIAQWLNQ